VPVKKSEAFGLNLNLIKIDNSRNWRNKLLNRLQQNYSKTKFYFEIYPIIDDILGKEIDSLCALNIEIIQAIVSLFEWDVEWRFSSDFSTNSKSSQRVLELLRWCSASGYYAAGGSFDYMKQEGIFPISDIEVMFQRFHNESYHQKSSPEEFIPYLSVLDALFNIGPADTAKLITANSNWLKWK
jgi:hypothetical protein